MSKTSLVDVLMPDLQGAEEIVIGTWVKRAGDHVDDGETIVEARTDKVNAEIPSTVTGIVAELLVKEGEQVTAGQAIARIEPE
jgi:2-oxoisovalerate dehydrogenase E2 component (dihydrolipoyl transacylase)